MNGLRLGCGQSLRRTPEKITHHVVARRRQRKRVGFVSNFSTDTHRGRAGAGVTEPALGIQVTATVRIGIGEKIAVEGADRTAISCSKLDHALLRLGRRIGIALVDLAGSPARMGVEQTQIVPHLVCQKISAVRRIPVQGIGHRDVVDVIRGQAHRRRNGLPGVGRIRMPPTHRC